MGRFFVRTAGALRMNTDPHVAAQDEHREWFDPLGRPALRRDAGSLAPGPRAEAGRQDGLDALFERQVRVSGRAGDARVPDTSCARIERAPGLS